MLKPKVSGCEAKRRVRRVDLPVPLGAERTIGGLEFDGAVVVVVVVGWVSWGEEVGREGRGGEGEPEVMV